MLVHPGPQHNWTTEEVRAVMRMAALLAAPVGLLIGLIVWGLLDLIDWHKRHPEP